VALPRVSVRDPEDNEEDKLKAGSPAKGTLSRVWLVKRTVRVLEQIARCVCEWYNHRHSLKCKFLAPWTHKRLRTVPLSISTVQIHLDASFIAPHVTLSEAIALAS
jgi:hypothetical protein